MKRYIMIFALLSAFGWGFTGKASAGESKKSPGRHIVMFYNVENLFDTIPSPGVVDDEFTPEGKNRWTGKKYWKKMENLEKVFYRLSREEGRYPAIIGVSEIENRNVLEDLAARPKLRNANYQIVHYDSPERRGVDVAFFYRPDVFTLEGSGPIKTEIEELHEFDTRYILSMWGTIEGERFCFFVCHWPSRLGGHGVSEFKRVGAATTVRHAIDSIRTLRPDTRFVVMGDMNDDPSDKSLAEALGGKREIDSLEADDMFNPFWQMHRHGLGTLGYGGAWNLFDNIVVSENLATGSDGGLKLYRRDKYHGYIFSRDFLIQKEGSFKDFPLRTYVGGDFQGGYSDHFPVYILIGR